MNAETSERVHTRLPKPLKSVDGVVGDRGPYLCEQGVVMDGLTWAMKEGGGVGVIEAGEKEAGDEYIPVLCSALNGKLK